MSLTKKALVENISEKLDLSKKESMGLFDNLFEIIKDELAKGNPVKISGFGKWTVSSKKARRGRNPQTGMEMRISARKVITFKASNVLRDRLND